EPAAQAVEHVLAEVGVFVEDCDSRLQSMRRDVAAVDRTLAGEARQIAHRPRIPRVLGRELRDTAADEELRDLAVVEIGTDRKRMLGADAVEDGEHLVLLDELARERD